MKSINNAIIERLNKMENFSLRYDGGKSLLWDLNAPGLHVLTVACLFMKFAGERGKWSLLYHSYNGDFFMKAYDILNKAGLTEDAAPEVWGYIRKLNKYARDNMNPEIRATTNHQLFNFIQDFLENILYKEYLIRTRKRVVENQYVFKQLLVAADSFIVRGNDGGIQIMAGYPWFDQSWGRDTFISLPGLLLVTERFEYAKSVFTFFARQQNREGLLPNRIFSESRKEYTSADGSLWFIEALHRYHLAARSKDADVFIKKMLPAVNRIIECYTRPTGDVRLDNDNLVVIPGRWSWMDAAPGGKPVTPRNGKPVEIQALFYNALVIASRFNLMAGNRKMAQQLEDLRKDVRQSVNERFFEGGRHYPSDVIDGDAHRDAVRPNALFLVSLSSVEDLLSQERKEAIIETVERELLTRYGVRTLAPSDARYVGSYDTFAPMEIKDRAYHQGSAWPYLMAHYVAAKKNALGEKREREFSGEMRAKIADLLRYARDNETLPEVFSGSEPFHSGGAVSQAWSVGALLEIFDLLSVEPEKARRAKGK